MQDKKLNILWMMLYWYPYEGPLQPVYGAIIKDLIAKGHNVTIVASFPHFRKGRPEEWREYRGKFFQKTQWEGAKLIRTFVLAPVFDQNKSGLFYRALNFISFNISSAIAGIFMTKKTDIVFVPSSPPLTNGLIGWFISLFKRCPLIYNVQDIYPDMAVKTGIIKKGFRTWFMKLIEKIVYKLSNKVVLLSEGMRKNVISKGVPPQKTEVISNFFDIAMLRPMSPENPFSKQWNPERRFLALYGGNVGIPHGSEVIIEAAKRLKDHPEILFGFVGRGEYLPTLRRIVEEQGLDNIVFIPPQPFDKMGEVWASAGVSLITYRKGLSGDSLPTKLIATMYCRRPVIAAADENSDIALLIKDSHCGLVVPPEDPGALAEALLSLFKNDSLRQQMGEDGSQYVQEHFKRDVVSQKYEDLFISTAKAN